MDEPWKKDPLGGNGPDGYMMQPNMGDESPARINRFFQGFRRDPQSEFYSRDYKDPAQSANVGPYYDLRSATVENAHQSGGLMRSLKGRHLQMIAIGGSVGK